MPARYVKENKVVEAAALSGLEEIEVDGMAGEYLEVNIQDDINSITGPVYFGVNGKVKS